MFEQKKPILQTAKLDDLNTMLTEFEGRIKQAKYLKQKGDHDGWLEAPESVIDYLYKDGLGKNPQTGKPLTYFIYDGIICYRQGTKEATEEQFGKTPEDIMGDPLPGKNSYVVK